ncbi:nucleotide sugar dehydrogenase [Sphingomonas lycopersici]|uniref:Nucleotide sugar dehydrogenase n=1 Tax=Sphingomonas lycopersici TaxID=2951807 RepID=A0AA42CSH1_9SPHN|nr:nucleotide sugar dehydrogenase [Sphingomonas lycopersici]MCW6537289.1 nucleotide sugar dehydrogenase [Sphingomonas lycopersici]
MNLERNDIGIVGLGYVGLTLAAAMADAGLTVVGVEKRDDVARSIANGKAHFHEKGLDAILRTVIDAGRLTVAERLTAETPCNTYIITVGTPLDNAGDARLDMITNASREVADAMPDGALVLLRSTVKIGTARNIVYPILQASGKTFDLAMCPERTLEGNALSELRHLPQIIGANDPRSRQRAEELFRRLTGQVLTVSSWETAEIIKLADNTFRDVRFGFANEIARLCDAVGVSANEVINTGKLGYPRTNIAFPGLVGGPCLEKDPHILCQSARAFGIDMEITASARLVNERQPVECAQFICDELDRRGARPDATIDLLGLAFKGIPETDDLRGAMSLHVASALKRFRPSTRLRAYDPVVSAEAIRALPYDFAVIEDPGDIGMGAAAIVITNNHPAFGAMSWSTLSMALTDGGFVYDFWNHFSDLDTVRSQKSYFAVGSTRRGGE